ncbi:hypothetical protein KNU14_gp79 [Gordonia phage Buggaboo]|uniref:Uncharacterized protein n=1 Tax=Gordonia phage Buggaboo TaxID=2315529 RepID=A0A386KFQ4_9CAUD|nr:hypothetical protein KNU14_gp79 [Gordonia phage Buggaboo]AVE00731.1 hypothetical protein SEA_SUPERSULLEY_79 [Gordonia phage SuperSulley]AYD83271.1 hypothetical protein SEA_BUGGABOO_79 [Gordonia phage Buggaboo]
MSPEDFEQAKSDALELANSITDHAAKYGWEATKGPKANRKFAFVTLRRDLDGDWGAEELKAFYAIDPDTDSDQVTHVALDGTQTVLDTEGGAVREAIENDFHIKPPPSGAEHPVAEQDTPVPPTSAAHSDVPPTDAAHTDTGDESAAHSAAHTEDELHRETTPEAFGIVPKADPEELLRDVQGHIGAAEKAKPKEAVHPTYSQQDTYAAVRQQQTNPHRNWSSVASPLTSEEILTKLGVNRKSNNHVEITWRNSLSGTIDSSVVDGSTEKYPPHITPAEFDPEEHGEDLRILHFIQTGGGFRSVAVARITKIG